MAKSIIRMAFFLTMPMSRMMPDSGDDRELDVKYDNATRAPTPAEGSSRESYRMDEALVEDAETI